jgi:antitoxin (DNA-binding transcriptional repressor) of toxin-antitoxin stability system
MKNQTIIKLSELRTDIYRLVDRVLETGEPLEIVRKGRRLRIVPDIQPSKVSRLVKREGFIRGDPGDLIHLDWSGEWKP